MQNLRRFGRRTCDVSLFRLRNALGCLLRGPCPGVSRTVFIVYNDCSSCCRLKVGRQWSSRLFEVCLLSLPSLISIAFLCVCVYGWGGVEGEWGDKRSGETIPTLTEWSCLHVFALRSISRSCIDKIR